MKCSEFCKLEELDCARCEKSYAILDHLAAYEDTGLEPEEITAIKNALMGRETAKITEFEGIPMVVLPPEGEDSAALAAMIDGDDRLRVWCIGNSDLLIGLLSTLADVVPVRHGRWIQTRITRYNGDKPYTQFAHNCSLCNWLNKKKKGWNTKFCPNCGAKMDKNEEARA